MGTEGTICLYTRSLYHSCECICIYASLTHTHTHTHTHMLSLFIHTLYNHTDTHNANSSNILCSFAQLATIGYCMLVMHARSMVLGAGNAKYFLSLWNNTKVICFVCLYSATLYTSDTPNQSIIILFHTILYCTVLYCTVLYCTVLYCTIYTILHIHIY